MIPEFAFENRSTVMDLFDQVFDSGVVASAEFDEEYQFVFETISCLLQPFLPKCSVISDPRSPIAMSPDFFPDRKIGVVVEESCLSHQLLYSLAEVVSQFEHQWVICVNFLSRKFNYGYIVVLPEGRVVGWGVEEDVQRLMGAVGFTNKK